MSVKTARLRIRSLLRILAVLFCAVSARADLVDDFRHDTRGQGMAAVALARQALAYSCRTHDPLPLPRALPPLLRQRGAAFVSTMVSGTGAPRCCMGTLTPRMPMLAEEIIQNAWAAAVHDKRFLPLTPADLPKLRVIVSIVGNQRPISDPAALDPVSIGMVVRGPRETGVVLPGETGDAQKMLAWGRIRAGLKANAPGQYFQLDAIRFIEATAPAMKEDSRHATHAH